MDLLDSLNLLAKRWWLTLPIFLLTLISVGTAIFVLPWSYEAKATEVFLASSVQAKQAGGNPWLIFDGSLTVTAEVVGREMMGQKTAATLKTQGMRSSYVVGVAPNSTGPVLAIAVTGQNSSDVAATLNAIMKLIPDKLEQIQADGGVRQAARIRLNVIEYSQQPTLKATSKIRMLAVMLFAGMMLMITVPLFAESISVRRRTRAAGTQGARPDPRAGPGGSLGAEAPAAPWSVPPPAEATAASRSDKRDGLTSGYWSTSDLGAREFDPREPRTSLPSESDV